MMPSLSTRSTLVLVLGGVLLGGCDGTGPKLQHLTLSVASTPTGVSPSSGIRFDVVVGSGPNSIRITSVEFVLGETQLSDAATCSTPPANDDNCNEMELDPILVNLPLTSSPPTQVLDALVPPGNYTRLQAELRAVAPGESENGGAAFLAAHPQFANISVRVTGVYTDGAGVPRSFTFTSGVDASINVTFTTPVTVDANTQNLTVTVDVAKWFTNATGAVLDPASSANAAAISANIRASFQAFEDNDEDGDDDGGGTGNIRSVITP